MAHLIADLSRDENKIRKAGESALQHAERFSARSQSERIIKMIRPFQS